MRAFNLPRPASFDSTLSAGMAEAADGWETITPARRALVMLAAHAGLEVVQARLTVEGAVTDSELWITLPSGRLGAIMLRSNRGRTGQSGFGYTGTVEEQAETRAALIAALDLQGGDEPGDAFSSLAG